MLRGWLGKTAGKLTIRRQDISVQHIVSVGVNFLLSTCGLICARMNSARALLMSQLPTQASRNRAVQEPEQHSMRRPHAVTPVYNDTVHIPLAQRTSDQLMAHARQLRRMAATASTADVMRALLTLADRYTALAEQRRSGPNFSSS